MRTRSLTIVALAAGLAGLGVVGLLSGPSPAQGQGEEPPIAEGLIAYWPLDDGGEGAGAEAEAGAEAVTRARDASGNGHDGELRNGPEWVEGVRGGALRFDGVDDFVFVPYDAAFDLEAGLTLALWAFLEADPDAGEGNDWRLLVGRNGFSPYGLLIEQSGRLNGTVYIGEERQMILSEDPLPVGEWVHVAFTYDAGEGRARLYLQGALIAEAEAAAGPFKLREGRPLTISLPAREGSPDVHAWPGKLDEIYFFGRPLTPEEVRALFEHAAPTSGSTEGS